MYIKYTKYICLNFDLNSEVSNKEVKAFHRQGKIC